MPDLLTVAEVQKQLRVNPATVRRMIKRGELEAYTISGYKITRASLERYLESQKVPSTQPDSVAK